MTWPIEWFNYTVVLTSKSKQVPQIRTLHRALTKAFLKLFFHIFYRYIITFASLSHITWDEDLSKTMSRALKVVFACQVCYDVFNSLLHLYRDVQSTAERNLALFLKGARFCCHSLFMFVWHGWVLICLKRAWMKKAQIKTASTVWVSVKLLTELVNFQDIWQALSEIDGANET